MENDSIIDELSRLISGSARKYRDRDLDAAVAKIGKIREQYELLKKGEIENLQKLSDPPLQYGIFLGVSPHQERDVLVGIGGARYEVRLADELHAVRNQLRPGQQVLLNSVKNVVAIRGEYAQGETAEVVNILTQDNSAEVIRVLEETPTRVIARWRDNEELSFNWPGELLGEPPHRGDYLQVDPDTRLPVARVRPRLHVRAGGSDGIIVEISDHLYDSHVHLGDLVRIDPGLKFAFEKLPSSQTGELTIEDIPDVTYDDIGGLDEQIDDFRDAVEMPYLQRALFTRYQLTRPKGILLYGPPGCGKTMVAKAVANSLTETIRNHLTMMEQQIRLYLDLCENPHRDDLMERGRQLLFSGQSLEFSGDPAEPLRRRLEESLQNLDVDLSNIKDKQREIRDALGKSDGVRSFFLNIKGPELLDKYVGETEHRIRSIFEEARSHATYYTPVVIFFDEMESMFRARGTGKSSDVETTIVPQFLSEIDGVEGSANVLLIGATNRDDMIDPAILRPGRLDVKIRIGRPNREAAGEIFSMYLPPTLPLNSSGLDKLRPQLPGKIVFRVAYARSQADPALEQLRQSLPPACDMRLAQSFGQGDLDHLTALAPDETVRKACARAQQEGDTHAVWEKLNHFKPGVTLGQITPALQAFITQSQQSGEWAALIQGYVEKEHLAESLIERALEMLYSSTSSIRVITRIHNSQNTNRYNFPIQDFVTGAVIANIVSRAKRLALKRDVLALDPALQGVSVDDLIVAIQHEFGENRNQLAVQKLRDELGRSNEEIQHTDLELSEGMHDFWLEEKPRPYREDQIDPAPDAARGLP